ncbi:MULTISPECIES: hypothetical protein [unclassified Mesorhizobium]|uniref:hypothetical protein n=1 Tax=unclassified Mesorhizobium TaxID=325217 RepID=UPI000FDB46CC|nr:MULTISPECIES: hypothetical protein [unclassified Mesorhizobium]TGQ16187.1 hypothetical protein EN862_001360 [Mesorhizobium sp. M2E.F.Ca.ET.219.01.1.1]TGT77718.1 hypothetical protein EN809_009195 [Mesorhizobium sp. M2E.F.Ca.ET.166.01.1.1]TGW03828.1 hypothetical protein EN797_009195 [Mesorhizobium sp. M2E.F.Ca.ET.154.01.1.1]
MHRLGHPIAPEKAVTLAEAGAEWHVMIEEPGHVTVVRSFDCEADAESYAETQKTRLGLDKVTRI